MSHTLLRQVVSPPVRAAALTAHSVMTAKSCPAARNPDTGPARAYSRDAASPQCHARPEERHWAEKKTKKPPAKGSYEGVMNGSPPSPMPVSYEPSMNFITSTTLKPPNGRRQELNERYRLLRATFARTCTRWTFACVFSSFCIFATILASTLARWTLARACSLVVMLLTRIAMLYVVMLRMLVLLVVLLCHFPLSARD
jgi:hypothetical protein